MRHGIKTVKQCCKQRPSKDVPSSSTWPKGRDSQVE